MKNKQFRQVPISQTERLRLKNSDATPLPFPVTMSHIMQECVGRPTRKLKLYTQMSIMLSDSSVVEFIDDADVLFIFFRLFSQLRSLYNIRNKTVTVLENKKGKIKVSDLVRKAACVAQFCLLRMMGGISP